MEQKAIEPNRGDKQFNHVVFLDFQGAELCEYDGAILNKHALNLNADEGILEQENSKGCVSENQKEVASQKYVQKKSGPAGVGVYGRPGKIKVNFLPYKNVYGE
ncbi:hypothetical protein TSAR_001735 [Trichomalopsis sarcophagae]|uniref:Uncharacterized protein n=1 Tax=Trichomalopsis sarcophagae TaxID=543379 RepID=A0A232F5C7_9HYME|nr:hypothetical protein TSAR_001735 [Trichomalopsis sarcophagae]